MNRAELDSQSGSNMYIEIWEKGKSVTVRCRRSK